MGHILKKKETYESQLTSGSEYITAPESGVVSYRVDGLESVLTSKSCWSDLDKSQALPKLISTLSKSLL